MDADILVAIDAAAPLLKIPAGVLIEPAPLLAAICGNETSWGEQRWASRFEPAYYRGGAYYKHPANDWLRKLITKYEHAGAASWGWGQIMYSTAAELGFKGHPWELTDADVCGQYVVQYLNRRTFAHWIEAPHDRLIAPADTIGQVGDSYNSGSARDTNKPEHYMAELETNYAIALKAFNGDDWP